MANQAKTGPGRKPRSISLLFTGSVATVARAYRPGDVCDVPIEEAQDYLRAGIAIDQTPKRKRSDARGTETAAIVRGELR